MPRADSLPAGRADMVNRSRRASAHHRRGPKDPREHGVTFDWFYRADRSMLPHHLAIEIARIEGAEQEF